MSINFIFFTLIIKGNKDKVQSQFEEKVYRDLEHKRNQELSHFLY